LIFLAGIFIVIALVFIALKSGFKLPFSSIGKPVELTYWGLWEDPKIIQPLIDSFEKDNPTIKIKYEMRDISSHFQTVQTRLQSTQSPDIVRIHSTWVASFANLLSGAPKDVFDNQTFASTFHPIASKMLIKNNQILAVPLEIDGLALIYNKDLFQKEKLTEPPSTWDKFRDDARLLTKKDAGNNIIQGGAALGFSQNISHFSDILGLMLAQNGVQFEDSKGQVQFHKTISPDARNLGAEALTFYNLFASSEKSYDPSWENSLQAFINGKVAMIFAPSYQVLTILGQNPNLNFGVAAVPQLPGAQGGNTITWASFWVEAVPKKSTHQKEAWQFLKYLTQKENQAALYRSAVNFRAFGEPFSRADLATGLSSDLYTAAFASQGPNYTSWFMADDTHDGVFNDAIIKLFSQALEKVQNGQTSESALNEIAPLVQKILDEQRK